MGGIFSGMLRATAIVGCALVAGCGGGGGGGSTPPQNRAPTFGTVQFSATEDTDLSAQVTATDADGDALTFTRTADPAKGAVTAFGTNGSFTYQPNRDAFGSDSFTVRVADSANNAVTGTVAIQITATPDPPVAQDDVLTTTAVGLANLIVLANDADPDGDTLTVTLESPAEVGTASVNAGGTIAISGLPAGFRGVTRFKYRVTDPGNTFSVGTAAVFVDIAPFRVVFSGDEPGNGSFEMYMTDLVSAPVKLTAATSADRGLRSFSASRNGRTLAYRRRDLSDTPVDFFFVRTANPAVQVPIQLPAGMQLLPATGGQGDLYVVSPDGQWIAGVASKNPPGTVAVILLNIADPTVVHTASAPDTASAQQLLFSNDSQQLYFLARPTTDSGLSLYRTAVAAPDQHTLISAPLSGMLDGVAFYSVSSDQSQFLLQAMRSGVTNAYYVSAANLRNEIQLNHPLNAGDEILGGFNQTVGGPTTRIGYWIRPTVGPLTSYIAEVSGTPNPRPIGTAGLSFLGMRQDSQAALLQSTTQIFEALVDSAQPPALVCDGFSARYDSRGDAVLAQVDNLPSQTNPEEYLSIAAAVRPTFGTTQHVGTPDRAAHFTNFVASDRAIVLMGEGPKTLDPFAQTFRMAIANAWAPDKLIYLADFLSTQNLRGSRVAVVDP